MTRRAVTVTAQRSGRWWVLESAEAGSVSQCRSLAEADAEMREAIAYQLGLTEDGFDIDVRVIPPPAYLDQMAAAEALRAEADRLALTARRARAEAAQLLARDGLSVRDIGLVMGVSHQRAHQLLSD